MPNIPLLVYAMTRFSGYDQHREPFQFYDVYTRDSVSRFSTVRGPYIAMLQVQLTGERNRSSGMYRTITRVYIHGLRS